MNPINILIVEGELTVAKSLALDLEHAGYTVAGMVDSGVKAMQKIAETYPDLVLMEIALKGDMDGITTSPAFLTNFAIAVAESFISSRFDPDQNEAKKTTHC